MNILIVGNGFDLSHYLPTKYDHFMAAINAIINSDEYIDEMSFDHLFGSLYLNQADQHFFNYTKSIYKTEQIKLKNLEILKEKISTNIWFQYFSEHRSRIETWIDFEKSIERALFNLSLFINKYQEMKNKVTLIDNCVCERVFEDGYPMILPDHISQELFSLGVLDEYQGNHHFLGLDVANTWQIKSQYIVGKIDIYNGNYDEDIDSFIELDFNKILKDLSRQLDELSEIFTYYLNEVVKKLKPKKKLKSLNLDSDVEIYSFNYTSTVSDLYSMKNRISFLHGSLLKNNIVLGIVEIPETLKKFKPFSFAKYAQKIIKNTDYHYLEDSRSINEILNNHKYDEPHHYVETDELRIFIWGHSLDISDSDYITQLFELEKNKGIRPTIHIYYHSEEAKRDMLFNLYTIMDQKIVNKWIVKKWLQFLPNPNIVDINQIKPVKLPEFDYF